MQLTESEFGRLLYCKVLYEYQRCGYCGCKTKMLIDNRYFCSWSCFYRIQEVKNEF